MKSYLLTGIYCGHYNNFKKKKNIFCACENMKKTSSKKAHNWPKLSLAQTFSTANWPKTSPNIIFCFKKNVSLRDFYVMIFCRITKMALLNTFACWNSTILDLSITMLMTTTTYLVISMSSLLAHKVAQPTKWRFLNMIGLSFTWSWVDKNEAQF